MAPPPFAFLPRQLGSSATASTQPSSHSKSHKPPDVALSAAPHLSRPPPPSSRTANDDAPTSSSSIHSAPTATGEAPRRSAHKDDDERCATALVIACSVYAIWIDPELRQLFENAKDHFVPLDALVTRSSYLRTLSPAPSQATLARAIRAHASHALEVRLRVVDAPSRAAWFPSRHIESSSDGGYEIRPVDASAVLDRAAGATKADWDARTVYVENVPHAHRDTPSLATFVASCLLRAPTESDQGRAIHAVQHVHLPPHHLDKPGDAPKCKGFAVVVFDELVHAGRLAERWPWDGRWEKRNQQAGHSGEEGSTGAEKEADRACLRALPKARYDDLQREYLAHRERLLSQMSAENRAHAPAAREPRAPLLRASADTYRSAGPFRERDAVGASGSSAPGLVDEPEVEAERREAERREAVTDSGARHDEGGPSAALPAYPTGCLVFVRHVHPQTNRTALRALFGRAFEGGDGKEVDYVDFNKGMDTCYLRLAAPGHAQTLLGYFTSNTVVQSTPDKTAGEGQGEPITLELVEGKKEEVYWERVPEKVKAQAVKNAFGLSEPQEETEQLGRKRKRRRK